MKHAHAHAHCAHKKLEFCGHCNVVWCHDCQAEFKPASMWWAEYPNTTWTAGYKAMTNAESPVQMSGTHRHEG